MTFTKTAYIRSYGRQGSRVWEDEEGKKYIKVGNKWYELDAYDEKFIEYSPLKRYQTITTER